MLRYVGGVAGSGRRPSAAQLRSVHLELVRVVMASPADLAMIPLQDWLGLDGAARMNRPGVARGNWGWRASGRQLTPAVARRLRDLARACERLPPGAECD